MEKNETKEIMPIQDMIHEIRGQNVMLDSDLAELYEIETGALNRAVKRNMDRFPDFFMFQLTEAEWSNLRCQIGILKKHKRKYLPYVFTEHGVLMLSSVLNSKKAISVNIEIMRAFVQMRHFMLSQSGSNEQNAELRRLLMLHIDTCDYKFIEHDEDIRQIMEILNNLIDHPKPAIKIGFGGIDQVVTICDHL